jgi:outer membrane beta-barrel protein
MKRLPAIVLLLLFLPGLVPGRARAAQGDRPHESPTPTPRPAATPTPLPDAPRPSAVEGGTLYSVQSRLYRPEHELRVAAGYLPQNAFYEGATVDVSYAYHFSDFVAWEAVRGLYSDNQSTGLVNRLTSQFGVTNQPFEEVHYVIASHLLFTPLYGKETLLNRHVIHQEVYAVAGPAADGWVIHNDGAADKPEKARPAFDLGAGFRWYGSKVVSFRLELLENIYQKQNRNIDEQLYATLGISLSLGR